MTGKFFLCLSQCCLESIIHYFCYIICLHFLDHGFHDFLPYLVDLLGQYTESATAYLVALFSKINTGQVDQTTISCFDINMSKSQSWSATFLPWNTFVHAKELN